MIGEFQKKIDIYYCGSDSENQLYLFRIYDNKTQAEYIIICSGYGKSTNGYKSISVLNSSANSLDSFN